MIPAEEIFSPQMLLAASAAIAAGLARGFSGFGAAMIMVPVFGLVFGPVQAVVMVQFIDLAVQAQLVPPLFRTINWRQVAPMALAAILTMPIGIFLLLNLDAELMRRSTAAVILALVAVLATGWRYSTTPGRPLTLATGGVSGFLSGSASIGGPPVILFYLGGQHSARDARAAIIGFFAVNSLVSPTMLTVSGAVTMEALLLAAVMAPAYLIATWAGSKLFGLASEKSFRAIAYLLVAAAALIGLFG